MTTWSEPHWKGVYVSDCGRFDVHYMQAENKWIAVDLKKDDHFYFDTIAKAKADCEETILMESVA